MPTRPLTADETLVTSTDWLNNNLSDKQSIKACCKEVNDVPKTKGIYFWFMHPEGYNALSNHVKIEHIKPNYTRTIDGKDYHLVYIGTAGTGKNGKSHFLERLKWHLCQHHNNSSICHGTLSTLRAGLGALLSEHLIEPQTEQVVNEFMCKFMKVFWIEYPDDITLIDENEKNLIKGIKPLLNLKNNPNARANAPANSTQVYKIRRAEVYNNTRLRLGCKGESEHSKKTNKKPTKDSPSFEYQVYSDENGCIEFFVQKNQSILDVVRGIIGLPEEACTFQILNSKTGLLVSEFKRWKTTGTKVHINPKAQNIYTYFSATGGKIDGRGTARWLHIQNRMNKMNDEIEEITIKVCSPHKITDKKSILEKITPTITNNTEMEMENMILSKNFKIVMVCAGGKNSSFFTAYPNEKFVNNPEVGVINEHHPDDKMNDKKTSWRDYLINNQNDNNLLEAYKLYKRNEYRFLHRKYKNNFYILSAGWGLVNSDYRLPNYNITFSSSSKNKNAIRKNKSIYKDFNQFYDVNEVPLISPEEDIIYVGGNDYLDLFYQLTKNLHNRKIIYFNSKNNPKPIFGNYLYRRYIINYSTNWHYELANKISNGTIP